MTEAEDKPLMSRDVFGRFGKISGDVAKRIDLQGREVLRWAIEQDLPLDEAIERRWASLGFSDVQITAPAMYGLQAWVGDSMDAMPDSDE